MSTKPRIMLVGQWPPTTGGVTTFMLNVVSSPLREKFHFLRFNTSRPVKKNVTDNYGYGAMFNGGIGRLLIGIAVTIWHIVSFPFVVVGRRTHIVQIQASDFQTFWESALYALMSRALGRPVIMRLGGSFDYFYQVSSPRAQRLIRRILHIPDQLIVQSAYWQGFVKRLGRAEKIIILPNWVPDALTQRTARPERQAPVCLFSAGTEAVRKGVDEVFGAMQILKSAGIEVRFRLVAAAPRVRERLVSENVDDLAEAEGYVDHERLLSIMRETDIFLLPSRGEGFPNSLIEAMASGMACIATPVGAVPEIVGTNGALIVPMRDAAALADAIKMLVENKQLREQIAENGRTIVRERYVASAVLQILEDTWNSMVSRTAVPRSSARPKAYKERASS